MRRKLLFALAVLFLGTSATVGYLYINGRQPPPRYLTARVERGRLTTTVNATGIVNAVITVQVGSQVSGNIQKLFVDFNSPVAENQIIAQIDPASFETRVNQARATLASAQAGVQVAQATVQNTKAAIETAKANMDSAKATVEKSNVTLVDRPERSRYLANRLRWCGVAAQALRSAVWRRGRPIQVGYRPSSPGRGAERRRPGTG
jgi:HlyD family secretion protein